MKTSRREFIRNSVFIGSGIAISSSALAGIFSAKRKFSIDVGVCTDIGNSDLLERAGYSFVEEGVRKFLVPSEDESVFLSNLELAKKSALPVKACNSFLPGNMKCVGSQTTHDEILKFAETAFRRAQMAGVGIIVFGSGDARAIPNGFPRDEAMKQFVSLCRQMAPIAGKYNVLIVLEPLNTTECNFINSVAEGGEIVKEVNHPNFLLLADIYHMKKDDESPANIIKYGHLLRHMHIAEKEGRAAPGSNNEDFTTYFEALKKIRYRGLISVECKWQNMESQLPLAIQTIRKQMEGL